MTTTMTRRSVQCSPPQKSGEPKTTTNAISCVFTVITTIAETSRARVGVLSRHRNLLKLRVSQAAGVCGGDSSLAYPASSHGKMRM